MGPSAAEHPSEGGFEERVYRSVVGPDPEWVVAGRSAATIRCPGCTRSRRRRWSSAAATTASPLRRRAGDPRRARSGAARPGDLRAQRTQAVGRAAGRILRGRRAVSRRLIGNRGGGTRVDVRRASALGCNPRRATCACGRPLPPVGPARRAGVATCLRHRDRGQARARRLRRDRAGRPAAPDRRNGRQRRLQPRLVAEREAGRLPAQPVRRDESDIMVVPATGGKPRNLTGAPASPTGHPRGLRTDGRSRFSRLAQAAVTSGSCGATGHASAA